MQRQIIYHLVEGDREPDLTVRFKDLTLSDYSSIVLYFKRRDGRRFTRPVTPSETDDEVGTVSWSAGDLIEGDHTGEFRFTVNGSSFSLPRQYRVIFRVRPKIG